MMQRLLLFFVIICIGLSFIPFSIQGQERKAEEQYQVIPDDAIRLRILANSDQEKDQQLKRYVRDVVNENITGWVQEITDIEEAYEEIESRLPEIREIVKMALEKKGVPQSFSVQFDEVDFPAKLYGNYVYPAGVYEAILITLGEGKGANWWCVLFPPLCFLDFDNGTSVAHAEEEVEPNETDEKEEVEVKFFLLEWLEWFFDLFR
ncbi:stage II sporulation protein R [Pontibacillus litoralis JSM 072002]|uniref:Stage II sporulation protein R n=2 Tax=Pontibacillus TaxID=289201 RepID=A0A0A5G5N4_9BACI|nr:stage II sporulation protein R [Pontibacillus litoralis JSM 072002]